MKYLIIDASLNGTGIRDKYNGGYILPEDLNLNNKIILKLKKWLLKYENEFFNDFINSQIVDELDNEGKEIALIIKNELSIIKIEYFSNAKMIQEIL